MVLHREPWIFEDLFGGLDRGMGPIWDSAFGLRAVQPADVSISDDGALVRIDLPGVDASDIDLQMEDGELRITADRKPVQGDAERIVLQERPYGRVERCVELPWAVAEDGVVAQLNRGVLTVQLTKAPELQARQIPVQVKP